LRRASALEFDLSTGIWKGGDAEQKAKLFKNTQTFVANEYATSG